MNQNCRRNSFWKSMPTKPKNGTYPPATSSNSLKNNLLYQISQGDAYGDVLTAGFDLRR